MLEMSALLIEKGANINSKNNQNNTPLHCAFAFGNLEQIKYLKASGAGKNSHNILFILLLLYYAKNTFINLNDIL